MSSYMGIRKFLLTSMIYGVFAACAYSQKAPGKLVDIGTAKLHINCTGNGGPTVILDAGAGGWSIHLSSVQTEIAKTNRVCSYDRAGFGWSSAGVLPRTAKQAAVDLGKLLNNSGERGPFVLVGTSFGGYIARVYRDLFPENVAGIGLIDSGHEDQWKKLPATAQMLQFGIKSFKDIFRKLETGEFKKEQFKSHISNDLLPIYQDAMTRKKTQSAFLSELESIDKSAEQLGKTGKIGNLPLMVLSAGNSFAAFIPPTKENKVLLENLNKGWMEMQHDLASLSTNSEHLISSNGIHSIATDKPKLVAGSVNLLIAMIESSKKSH